MLLRSGKVHYSRHDIFLGKLIRTSNKIPVEAQFNYNQGVQIAGRFYDLSEHHIDDVYDNMELSKCKPYCCCYFNPHLKI